jgi:hypothetical protein
MAPPVTLGDALKELGRVLRTGFGAIRINYQDGKPVSVEPSESFRAIDLGALLTREVPRGEEAGS